MPSTPLVQFASVEKRFGSGPAVLQGIDLTVAAGEFVSLIGPSGCGKSTMLRLIAGLTPVSSGKLSISEQPPGSAAPELGFVFQEPTLLPWLTVAKNVEVPLILRGFGSEERARRRERALAQVRLAEKSKAYPQQLSGGQKMRVSVARALALQPEILLLDEPFGALDEMTRDHLNEELLSIRQQQAWTAFFVTHSVAEAVFLSNRIVVLAAGPGRIHSIVEVPFAYPRTADTRQSDDFHHLVVRVSRALRSVDPTATSAP
ncbi:nitrate/sulfonate/bicarbonate ABC transporter ATP-binding protein [Opitutaceae bacterium EW11]|nr:nitrate/sulfonate/bicarbonate ABC transporter ATP-binding protein [Opitutaceae bacterium EW11]